MTVALGLGLVVLWTLLWGELSPANVLSGVVVAAVLLALVPDRSSQPRFFRVRPVALVRLGLYLLRQLVVSNVELAREVLRPKTAISTGIIGVPVPGGSDEVLTLMANLWAMSPGTMPVEVRRSPPIIYVHVLHVRSVEDARRQLIELRELVMDAFGPRNGR